MPLEYLGLKLKLVVDLELELQNMKILLIYHRYKLGRLEDQITKIVLKCKIMQLVGRLIELLFLWLKG